jgi:hypothetical protein
MAYVDVGSEQLVWVNRRGQRLSETGPPASSIFYPAIVLDGRVAGTWKRTIAKGSVRITLSPFAPLKKKERQVIAVAAERYGAFLGMPIFLEPESLSARGARTNCMANRLQ